MKNINISNALHCYIGHARRHWQRKIKSGLPLLVIASCLTLASCDDTPITLKVAAPNSSGLFKQPTAAKPHDKTTLKVVDERSERIVGYVNNSHQLSPIYVNSATLTSSIKNSVTTIAQNNGLLVSSTAKKHMTLNLVLLDSMHCDLHQYICTQMEIQLIANNGSKTLKKNYRQRGKHTYKYFKPTKHLDKQLDGLTVELLKEIDHDKDLWAFMKN